MAGMGIDGLFSGLKTTDLINQLMQVEAMPQTLLKSKVASTQTFISTLQGLNTRIASFGDAAKTAAKPESWQAATGTSSNESVKVTAGAGAQPSSISFTVDQLATAQRSVSGAVSNLADLFGGTVPERLTISSGPTDNPTLTTVELTDVTSLSELAARLSTAGTGVTAAVVKISATESRLQVVGTGTGADAGFDLFAGQPTDAGYGDTAVLSRTGAAVAASDAQITVLGQQVRSTTNTFADVLEGVSFTVSAQSAEPVTLTVSRDDAALAKLASNLVGTMGVVLAEITARTRTTTTTTDDGRTVVTGGVLSGDSATRNIQQSLTSALSYPVDGTSPSEVGIEVDRYGAFTFDEEKFAAAMAKDPALVQKVVTGLAERVAAETTSISDPIDGTLTTKITNQESFSKNLGEQILDWDRRLANRRAGLQRTYASLEVTLSGLQAQSSWLAGQVNGLSSSK